MSRRPGQVTDSWVACLRPARSTVRGCRTAVPQLLLPQWQTGGRLPQPKQGRVSRGAALPVLQGWYSVFGTTNQGCGILLRLLGFHPYFYIAAPLLQVNLQAACCTTAHGRCRTRLLCPVKFSMRHCM